MSTETCEDRGFECCEQFPPPFPMGEMSTTEYGEWYDAHVTAYRKEQAK